MEKSFGCFFYLKKKGKNLSDELPIYLRITVDSHSTQLSTKRKCFKANCSLKAGRVDGKNDYAKNINVYLDTLQQKVFEAKRRLIEVDQEVTPSNIKEIMLGRNINKQRLMLMELFRHHNEQMKALIERQYEKAPLKDMRHLTSIRLIFCNHDIKFQILI
ncbi:MAG: Arm DNA-binding domain-containing protein [Chitinophagaceae bacterium]